MQIYNIFDKIYSALYNGSLPLEFSNLFVTAHPSIILSYGGESHGNMDRSEWYVVVIAVAIAVSIILGAIGILAIRLAIAYAIIKKANHKG